MTLIIYGENVLDFTSDRETFSRGIVEKLDKSLRNVGAHCSGSLIYRSLVSLSFR